LISKTALEKISLSKLTSLLVESKAEVFIVATSSMINLLGKIEIVNLVIFEVAFAIFLGVSAEIIVEREQTCTFAHIWEALLMKDIYIENVIGV